MEQRIARSVISSTRAVHFTAPLDEQPLHNLDGTEDITDLDKKITTLSDRKIISQGYKVVDEFILKF